MSFPYFDARDELRNHAPPESASPDQDSFEARGLARFEAASAQHAREAAAKAERDTTRAFGPPDGGYAWDDGASPRASWTPRRGVSREQARAETRKRLELDGGVIDGAEARRLTERAYAPQQAAETRGAGTAADLLAWMREREPEIRHRWGDL